MDSGRAVEFDEPHILLQKPLGIFYGMVKALGPKEFQRLSQVALEKFNVEHCGNNDRTSLENNKWLHTKKKIVLWWDDVDN